MINKCVRTGFLLKGGNQKELAFFLGKSPVTVNNYLAGRTDPPFSVVLKMAEYFEVDAVVFFSWGREL